MNRSSFPEFDLAARPAASAGGAGQDPDGLREFLSILSMSRLMIFVIVVLGVVAGAVVGLTRVTEFEADAAIILSPGRGFTVTPGQGGPSVEPNTSVVESEIELLRSSGLAAQVLAIAGEEQALKWVERAQPALFDLAPQIFGQGAAESSSEIVRQLRRSTRIARQQSSYVIEITATSTTPQYAADLANAMTDAYLRSKVQERADAFRTSSEWLAERLDALKDEVALKEAAVEAYRAEMRLLDINGNLMSDSQLGSVQASLLDARGALAERNARLEQLNRLRSAGGSTGSIFAVLSSPVVLELRTREADISARKAELEERYGPQHPSVTEVLREHEEIQVQVAAEVERILANLENEVDIARIRVAELQRNQSQLEGRVITSNRELVRLRDLERQAAAASELYQQYLLMSREAGEQESQSVVDARVVSLATPPTESSSPSRLIWPAFLGVAGLLAGVVLALLRSGMNNRLMRPEDVLRKVHAEPLVSVPLINAIELSKLDRGMQSPAHMIVAKPMSRAAESIRVLLSQIITGRIDNDCMVVAVTSALAHEGKTTVATSLGQIAAMSGMRVLLIEGDLRMRSLSMHAPPVDAGLVEALRKEVTWNSVLVTDPETGAQFLPVKAGGFTLGNVFATGRMRVVLAEMRPDYDLIIIDCPPVLAVADARTLALLADGTVIISRWNKTPAPAVRTAIREIESAGGRVVGVVLNRLKPSVAKRISYGDSLYFGAAGSKYYEG